MSSSEDRCREARPVRDSLFDRAEQFGQMGTWEWDPDTQQIAWSDNLFRLLGLEPAEFLPTREHLFERMHPSEVERVRGELDAAWNGNGPPSFECRIVRPDGVVRHIRSAPVEDSGDGADHGYRLVSFVRDVTENVCRERELAVQLAVSSALAEWEAFRPGAERLLRELAEALGLEAAALWLPRGDVLAARVVWSGPTVDGRALERFLGQHRLPRGVGLAGRAWERREPVTPSRSGTDDAFLGRQAAALDGICSALAIPTVSDGEVSAVIVLYSADPLEHDEHLMRAFTSAGRQLGTFLARRPGMLTTPLTVRELEVLTLAAQGLTGPEIAARLLLSAATVKTHLENLYAKIGVSSRVAAVAFALREGLID